MKKVLLVFVLITIISTGTVFADHPSGLGIGVMGSLGGGWEGGSLLGGLIISLKLPSMPVYWGVDLAFGKNYFRLGVIGDYYLIDRVLINDINLNWFVGVGGWVNCVIDPFSFGFGARLPIGLSWQPIKILEVFINIAPSIGISLNPFYFPAGGIAGEIGVRLWL